MLFHAFEEDVLLLLREPGEPQSTGRADLSLAKSRLSLCGEFLDQCDALRDPCLSVIEEGSDRRNRHTVIGHQRMSNTGFVQSRDRATRTVCQQQAFLVIGRSSAVFDDNRDFGISCRAPGLETFEAVNDFIAVLDGGHSKRQR